MARQFGWALALIILLGSTAPAARAEDVCEASKIQESDRRQDRQERRRWWKDERDVATLGLTPQQSAEIDGIFREWVQKARPKREELQKLERQLDHAILAATDEVRVFARLVDDVENRRAELNKLRYVMLYRIHRVLSREQYAKLKAMEEAHRKKQDGDRHR